MFHLPKYIVLSVLIDWLAMNELGWLDCALTNSEIRKEFLLWIGESSIAFNGALHEKYNGPLYWTWLNLRKIKVRYASIFCRTLENKRMKRGTCWELLYDKIFNRSATSIISSVVPENVLKLPYKVNSLFLSAVEDQNLSQIFPLQTQPLISLKLTHFALEWESSKKILCDFAACHYQTLKDLVVQDCSDIPDRLLIDVLKKCSDLVHLQLLQTSTSQSSTKEFQSKTLKYDLNSFVCVKLQSLSLVSVSCVNDAFMAALLPRCPLLQHFMIIQCDVSDVTVNSLAEHCPVLISVVLEPSLKGFITDAPILAIAESCPQLEYWSVVSTASVQTYITLIESCPKLRLLDCGYFEHHFGALLKNKKHIKLDPTSRLSGWFEPYPFLGPC